METLVATVLIVVIFMMASMILNNLFSNSIKNDIGNIKTVLNELEYQYINKKIQLPYQTDFNKWQIMIDSYDANNQTIIEFEAIHTEAKKTITKKHFEVK